jgi:hypothetical protein
MKNNPDKLDRKAICANLANNSIELIDFDAVRLALEDDAMIMEELAICQRELTALKEQYRGRIIGMLKANMAAKENEDDLEALRSLSGELATLDAETLIRHYNRAAARFRANFPASFKYLSFGNSNRSSKQWGDYKI